MITYIPVYRCVYRCEYTNTYFLLCKLRGTRIDHTKVAKSKLSVQFLVSNNILQLKKEKIIEEMADFRTRAGNT